MYTVHFVATTKLWKHIWLFLATVGLPKRLPESASNFNPQMQLGLAAFLLL